MSEAWNIRFGTAGTSDSFAAQGYKSSLDVPEYTAKMGLNAFEYQCGRGVRIKEELASKIRAQAAVHGTYFSLHAPYYISMSSLEEEKRLPIIILEPGKAYRREDGSVGQNFYAKEVFDISQTTARDEAQPQVSCDDRLLLKALISNSPVPIRAVEELPAQGRGAMFDPEQNAILVKKGMDAPDIFRCVSLELANAQLARSNPEYSRETEGYKAYAVSYMLCQRYGVEAGGYNISRLDGVLQGQDPKEEIPAALTDMRDTFKEINGRMARAMGLSRAGRQKEQER